MMQSDLFQILQQQYESLFLMVEISSCPARCLTLAWSKLLIPRNVEELGRRGVEVDEEGPGRARQGQRGGEAETRGGERWGVGGWR